jgi:hypothetical protein
MNRRQIPPFVSHGTSNAYVNYDCRCELCKEAHSAALSRRRGQGDHYRTYMREYMRKYRARQKLAKSED